MTHLFNKLRRWCLYNLFYLGRPPWDTGISPPELQAFLREAAPGRALDVGCGTGTNLVTMAECGWKVVGVDIAWLSVLRAKTKLKCHDLAGRVVYGDITENLDIHPPFDFILDIGCYHSLSPSGREEYRQHIGDWLLPGGSFLIYGHRRRNPAGTYGISEGDLKAFQSFLTLNWRDDGDESRPDGGGGFPAIWVRFDRGRGD